MTATGALPCPSCRRVLDDSAWGAPGIGACPHCTTPFEFLAMPALQMRARPLAARAVVAPEQAACFFHADNQAESVCEDCGRFLCNICTVEISGRRLCPGCVAVANRQRAALPSCVRYDSVALALAVLPLLLWPFTALTAPAALGLVIYGWRKPRSIVSPRPVRFILAGVFALLVIAGWVVGITLAVVASRGTS